MYALWSEASQIFEGLVLIAAASGIVILLVKRCGSFARWAWSLRRRFHRPLATPEVQQAMFTNPRVAELACAQAAIVCQPKIDESQGGKLAAIDHELKEILKANRKPNGILARLRRQT